MFTVAVAQGSAVTVRVKAAVVDQLLPVPLSTGISDVIVMV